MCETCLLEEKNKKKERCCVEWTGGRLIQACHAFVRGR